MNKAQKWAVIAAQARIVERDQNLWMFRTPEAWPRRPILPLKKRNETHDVGILLEGEGPVVWLINAFSNLTEPDWEDIEKKYYSSYEVLLEDGWVVD